MDESSYRYRSPRADDSALRERLRALAAMRRRFGYRRLAWMLEREGVKVNMKKVYRIYREEGLTVKRRRGRRRTIGARAPIVVPQNLNQRWSLDFVSDRLRLYGPQSPALTGRWNPPAVVRAPSQPTLGGN